MTLFCWFALTASIGMLIASIVINFYGRKLDGILSSKTCDGCASDKKMTMACLICKRMHKDMYSTDPDDFDFEEDDRK